MKESYDILFSITFEHNYYKDGFCTELHAEPDELTKNLFKKYGFVYRLTRTGLIVIAKSISKDDRIFISDKIETKLQFNFHVNYSNPYLHNITDIESTTDEVLHYYSNRSVDSDTDNRNTFYFNSGNLIEVSNSSTANFESHVQKPCFLIRVELDDVNIIGESGQMLQPKYILKLQTRKTFWQYIITKKDSYDSLTIDSQGNSELFNKTEDIIHGNKSVIIFTSKETFPITQSRENYFRLKIRNADPSEDFILISKLPLPAITALNRIEDGKMYTPIYVNY